MPEVSPLTLQPMVHVAELAPAIRFYQALGAELVQGSSDGDWALLRLGAGEFSLLAHPPNPEQEEGTVELNFESGVPLAELEAQLRTAGVEVARTTTAQGFGQQLQLRSPDGLLIKVNTYGPGL